MTKKVSSSSSSYSSSSDSVGSSSFSNLTTEEREDLTDLIDLLIGILGLLRSVLGGGDDDEDPPFRILNGPKTGGPTNSSNVSFNPGSNSGISRWSDEIKKAAAATGLDPNLIGAMMWAESRGNPNTSTTNSDGTTDKGLMQISQERWNRDIVPKLSSADRAKIKQATGLEPEQLNMSNPLHNVIGGAFELKGYLNQFGGDLEKALNYYVSGSTSGNPTYVKNVLRYLEELRNGKPLSEDPYGSP